MTTPPPSPATGPERERRALAAQIAALTGGTIRPGTAGLTDMPEVLVQYDATEHGGRTPGVTTEVMLTPLGAGDDVEITATVPRDLAWLIAAAIATQATGAAAPEVQFTAHGETRCPHCGATGAVRIHEDAERTSDVWRDADGTVRASAGDASDWEAIRTSCAECTRPVTVDRIDRWT